MMRRNMIFHVYPVRHIGTWQRCLDRLLPRIGQFNGTRVVSVVTDDNTDHPDAVKEYLDSEAETIVLENARTLQEVHAWKQSWQRINLNDADGATFYGHAKGVTRGFRPGAMVHLWTDIMMETLLDYPALVSESLTRYPITGSLKKHGNWFPNVKCPWHYTGTFFWVRNTAAQCYHNIADYWFGTEAWPGMNFDIRQAGCIFYDHDSKGFNMYDRNYVLDTVLPELQEWRANHAVL